MITGGDLRQSRLDVGYKTFTISPWFRTVFERAGVGIALVAPDGGWLRVNDALCQIVGYSQDEFVKLTFQDITHPDDLDSDLYLLRQLIDDEIDRYQLEKRYITKSGNTIVWLISVHSSLK